VLASLLASLAWRGALVGILTAPLYCCFGVLYALLLLPRVLLRKLDRRAFGPTLDAADGGGMGGLLLALEAPLALLSYVLYQTTKFFVLPMMSSFEAARRGVDETWVDKLHENIEDPGRIPRLTVFAAICWAPRWNTHTNVHVLWLMDPPEGEATFEVENVRQRGFSWQVIFYDGRQQTLGSIASSPTGGEWLALTLRTAGALQLTIRPYLFDGCASATLPRVRMNGVEVTRGAPVVFKRERLGFNARLKGAYETPLHWALQWHTYVLLCCRSMVSAEAVRAIYLPVGNPETQWLYGATQQGYSLRFELPASLLEEHLVFCSVYDRASFPLLPSLQVERPSHTLPPCGEDGFWATRIVRKDGTATRPEVLPSVRVTLERPSRTALH